MPGETWAEYWDGDDFWSHSRLWRVNDRVFLRRAAPVVGFRADDTVCTVGCGTGHMERLLAPRVAAIHALDVSPRYVAMCRENCAGHENVTVQGLGENYTDLGVTGRRFSLFLCVSVVQYYNDPRDIESLVRSAHEVAEPGARMLIADLPRKRGPAGFAWDAACSVAGAVAGGYAPALARTAWSLYARRGAYRRFGEEHEVLEFTIADIEGIVERLEADAVILRRSLSVYANRPSLLIRF